MRVRYQFFTNVKDSIAALDVGWENSISGNLPVDSNNRAVQFGPYTGNKDTTIALQYVNGGPSQPQWFKPFVPSTDSVAVLFRINMQSNEGFNKSTMKLGSEATRRRSRGGRQFSLSRKNVTAIPARTRTMEQISGPAL